MPGNLNFGEIRGCHFLDLLHGLHQVLLVRLLPFGMGFLLVLKMFHYMVGNRIRLLVQGQGSFRVELHSVGQGMKLQLVRLLQQGTAAVDLVATAELSCSPGCFKTIVSGCA